MRKTGKENVDYLLREIREQGVIDAEELFKQIMVSGEQVAILSRDYRLPRGPHPTSDESHQFLLDCRSHEQARHRPLYEKWKDARRHVKMIFPHIFAISACIDPECPRCLGMDGRQKYAAAQIYTPIPRDDGWETKWHDAITRQRQFFANETKTNKTKKNASAEGGQSGILEESQNDAILIFEEPVAKRAKFHHAPKIERVLKIVGFENDGRAGSREGDKEGDGLTPDENLQGQMVTARLCPRQADFFSTVIPSHQIDHFHSCLETEKMRAGGKQMRTIAQPSGRGEFTLCPQRAPGKFALSKSRAERVRHLRLFHARIRRQKAPNVEAGVEIPNTSASYSSASPCLTIVPMDEERSY